MQGQKVSVYGLKDRRNDELFYVGMSIDPYSRYGEHLSVRRGTNNSAKDKRILDMRMDGIMPELVIIQQDIPSEDAPVREKYWIHHYASLGIKLTNLACNPSYKAPKPTKKYKAPVTTPGWLSSEEAAEIISDTSGHTVSADYVRLLSNAKVPKIRSRAKDGRTKEYHEGDVRAYRVREKGVKEKSVA